jgi:hypothetical protein
MNASMTASAIKGSRAGEPGRNVVVVGTQWGDEGKGKVVDWLTDHAQAVVRFQGGHNAGHTLVINGTRGAAAPTPPGRCARRPLLHQAASHRSGICGQRIAPPEAMGLQVRIAPRSARVPCDLAVPRSRAGTS